VPIADDFDVVDDGESEGDESMHDHMDEDDIEEEIDPDQAEEGEGADVFRNSALGMFGGELEPAMADDQYSGDDMDEQMEEWDDQGEEMMEEEIVPR
jgi:E3 ubiquitin-protein ligase HUWE1